VNIDAKGIQININNIPRKILIHPDVIIPIPQTNIEIATMI